MKTKIPTPLTQQKRLDLYNELVKLLDTKNLQGHARASEIIARLAYDDGTRFKLPHKPEKGAKHENEKPKVADS